MPLRPVAQRVWAGTTTTGTSATAYFGSGFRFVSAFITNASTKSFVAAVEVSVGNSSGWTTVLVAASSTGSVTHTSTGGTVFDKARVLVSANASTGVADVWLLAGD